MATTFRCVLMLLAFAAGASALEKAESAFEQKYRGYYGGYYGYPYRFLQKSSDFTFEQQKGYPY